MADGEGCKCAAHSESECGCNADWTPQELIDARAEIERLRLTDEEREALWCAVCDYNNMTRMMHKPTHGEIGAALARLFERTK